MAPTFQPRGGSPFGVPLFIVAFTACAAPRPSDGFIAIDHKGVAGRLRRACELTQGASVAGPCASTEAKVEAEDDASEPTASDDPGDAGAWDGAPPDASSADAYDAAEDRSDRENLAKW